MRGLVSNRRFQFVSLIVAVSIVSAAFILSGYTWMGFACASLAFSLAIWAGMESPSTRSMSQVIAAVEGEPALAKARIAPAPQAVL